MKNAKKRRGNEREQPQSNPIYAGLVKILFEIVKYLLNNNDMIFTDKKAEDADKQFEEMKGMILELEKKTNDYRRMIEQLQARILWGNILFLILIIIMILQMVL